jgi:hypothetical protein
MHPTPLLAVDGGGATSRALARFGPAAGTGKHGDRVAPMCSSHHDPSSPCSRTDYSSASSVSVGFKVGDVSVVEALGSPRDST